MMTPDEHNLNGPYEPHCIITKEMQRVGSLRELQGSVGANIGVHCSLGALGAFSNAQGTEPLQEFAHYLQITPDQLTPEAEWIIRNTIIPWLSGMVRPLVHIRTGFHYCD